MSFAPSGPHVSTVTSCSRHPSKHASARSGLDRSEYLVTEKSMNWSRPPPRSGRATACEKLRISIQSLWSGRAHSPPIPVTFM